MGQGREEGSESVTPGALDSLPQGSHPPICLQWSADRSWTFLTDSHTRMHTLQASLTLFLIIFLPGFRVVLLWGCPGLLGLLACGQRHMHQGPRTGGRGNEQLGRDEEPGSITAPFAQWV